MKTPIARFQNWGAAALAALSFIALAPAPTWADGMVRPPRNYQGSLEEKAQEAIIIFHASETPGEATEDLILKISVEGDAEQFGWVIPFPNEPQTEKEDPKLFAELFNYVEAQRRPRGTGKKAKTGASPEKKDSRPAAVQVLSRKVVGSFEVAVLREKKAGALNQWLEENGYQPVEDAEDVLGFYRKKGYVFACVKVSDAAKQGHTINLHPLRFSFKTGGRDGIYFPMKMTGLQTKPFDVNLYVFFRYWINNDLSKFGYVHRGFSLVYRDYDTARCVADGGKAYSAPATDPLLQRFSHHLPTVKRLFQRLHPGERYYLTNIQARQLRPDEVRAWSDDLWMFPYYTNRGMIPYDVRNGGPASAAWPHEQSGDGGAGSGSSGVGGYESTWLVVGAVAGAVVLLAAVAVALRLSRKKIRTDARP